MRKSSGGTIANPSTSTAKVVWTFGRANIGAQSGDSFGFFIDSGELDHFFRGDDDVGLATRAVSDQKQPITWGDIKQRYGRVKK
jgi:hypothetical protein